MRQNQSQNNNINEANGASIANRYYSTLLDKSGKCVISGKIDIRFKIGDLKNHKHAMLWLKKKTNLWAKPVANSMAVNWNK